MLPKKTELLLAKWTDVGFQGHDDLERGDRWAGGKARPHVVVAKANHQTRDNQYNRLSPVAVLQL